MKKVANKLREVRLQNFGLKITGSHPAHYEISFRIYLVLLVVRMECKIITNGCCQFNLGFKYWPSHYYIIVIVVTTAIVISINVSFVKWREV